MYETLSMPAESSWPYHAKVKLTIMSPEWIILPKELMTNTTIYDASIWPVTFDVVFTLQVTRRIHVLAKLVVVEAVVNVLKACAVRIVMVTFTHALVRQKTVIL